MTRLLDRYLSFYGRLARLPFFLRQVYLTIAAAVLFALSISLLINGGLWWWLGILAFAGWAVLLCAGNASLIVRRLHDLGWSGYHIIWVGAAEIGSLALSYGSPKFVLLGLPLSAVSLWLLFWPGNAKANRFGAVPE
jgi:uncharacterized membrane protein YhaH (DUF805 family)